MIYDTLNNLPNYLGMSDNLDAVIEFVMARDINNLPAGKTRINGDKAVVIGGSSKVPFDVVTERFSRSICNPSKFSFCMAPAC